MIRVFIVAPSASGRAALQDLLHDDARFIVVGSGGSIAGWELSSRRHPPDVLLADASESGELPPVARFSDLPPLVLLADDLTRPQIRTALFRGARAILARDSSLQEIAAALIAAAAGLTALGAEQIDALLPSTARLESDGIAVEPLTARELEVLALLAEGAANKDIAHQLALSEHTVKFHVSSILGKLGATSRTEAVREGIRRGLVLL
jgi:DNA-binding NarL/FixJ family response regulator